MELTYLYENRNVSETLYTNYLQLKSIHENLTSIIESKTNADSALVSKNQTQQYLADVNNLVTQINNITAGETYTLTAGSPAKVLWVHSMFKPTSPINNCSQLIHIRN